jgi:hypothetical protein
LNVDYGSIGVWLLVIGAVAVVVEGALAGLWSFGLARRAQELRGRLVEEQERLQVDVERLRLAIAETETLWQPYARLLRWLRHPIVIALIQSYARRRAAPVR